MDVATSHDSALAEAKPKKRRNRRPKACKPCRARKVRCDYGQPCSTCQKRQHTHLCIYDQSPRWIVETRSGNTGRAVIESFQSTPYYGGVPDHRHSSIAESPNSQSATSHASQELSLDPELPTPATTNTSPLGQTGPVDTLDHLADNPRNICEEDDQTGETLYVGQNSSAAFFQGILSILDGFSLPSHISIGSAFGLTNRTPLHPFGSLWAATANVTLRDILGSLPTTDRCMRYYRAYQQIAIPFVPYLLNPEDFERGLFNVVQMISDSSNRSVMDQAAADLTYGELAGYSLLFAVLAAGCQFADEVSSERILTTRVFVACSFECLRLANFYVQPSLETIQTTLILEYVIANDSNPGVGWTFLAISVRQSESQGLHLQRPLNTDGSVLTELHPMWKAAIHMDGALAFAFDRRPNSFLPKHYDPVQSTSMLPTLTFFDLVHAVNCIKLEWQAAKLADPAFRGAEIDVFLARLDQIHSMSQTDRCQLVSGKSMETRLQQLVFGLHISHFKAELCRFGSLAKDMQHDQRRQYFDAMAANYVVVVESFLNVKPLSPIVQVSWDLLFYTMSAALILGGLQLAEGHQSHQVLLRAFLKSLLSFAAKKDLDRPNETSTCPVCHGASVLESLIQKADERG